MENDLHNDQNLKYKLQGLFSEYQETPSDDVWFGIDEHLGRKKVAESNVMTKHILVSLLILTFICAGTSIIWQTDHQKESGEKPVHSENIAKGNSPATKATDLKTKELRIQSASSASTTAAEKSKDYTAPLTGNILKNKSESDKQALVFQKKLDKRKANSAANNHYQEKDNTVREIINDSKNIDVVALENQDQINQTKAQRKELVDDQDGDNPQSPAPVVHESVMLDQINSLMTKLALSTSSVDPDPKEVLPLETKDKRHSIFFNYGRSSLKPTIKIIRKIPGAMNRNFNENSHRRGVETYHSFGYAYRMFPGWELSVGLKQSNSTLYGKHSGELKLKDRIGHDRKEGHHSFKYGLNTSTGELVVDVRIDQNDPSQDFVDDEVIKVNVKSKQSIKTTSIPISLNRFAEIGKWRMNIGTGFAYNSATISKISILEYQLDRSDFKSNSANRKLKSRDGVKKQYIEWLGQLGLSYNFNKNIGLGVQFELERSITDFSVSPAIKSNLIAFGANIGLRYSF